MLRPRPLLAIASAAFGSLLAQTVSTEILGRVTDTSGAIIPGAAVTAKRVATGDTRSTETNEIGLYAFPLLEIGEYEVTCTAAGFKTEVRRGIVLQLQQKARIDFELPVGQQLETVLVTAAAPLLRTEDATLGAVIESKRVVDLPLNGRNFSQLATLAPGLFFGISRMGQDGQGTLADLAPPGQMSGISANGQRDANQNITLDGVVAVDPLHSAMLFAPSIDAVQEFKVQSAVYSAEYGMNSGAQVNVAIKSGTNDLHGTVFEFVRNDIFDARGFFLLPEQSKNILRRNQFGAVVSGPIARDRTFWLFSWESRRERRATPATTSVPTLAMRSGDFSELLEPQNRWYPRDANPAARSIRYPGSDTPFPNNVIPPSLINRVSRALLTHQPTSPFPEGGFLAFPNIDAQAREARNPINLAGTDDQIIDTDQYLGRVDQRLTDSDRLFGRYAIVPASWDRIPLTKVSRLISDYRSQNVAVGYTRIITPTVLNELRYGLNRTSQNGRGIQTDTDFRQNDVGLDFRVVSDNNRHLTRKEEGIPNIGITGFAGMSVGQSRYFIKQIHELSENISVSRGAHQLKFGALYRYNMTDSAYGNIIRGQINFTRDIVGIPDGFAAFMLGFPTNANTAEGASLNLGRQGKYGFYGLDDWKVTSKLTVNYGIRWDIFGAVTDVLGGYRNLSFAAGEARVVNGIFAPMLVPNPKVRKKLYDINLKQIMPRLGIAYRFANTAVLRIGAGQFYNAQQMNNFTILNLQPPLSGSTVFENDRVRPTATFENPFAGSAVSAPQALIMLGNIVASRGNRSFYLNNHVWQWSMEVEKSLGEDLVAALSYVGSAGSHLDTSVFNANNPDPGLGNIQARRPYPFYVDSREPDRLLSLGTIRQLETSINSNYNALQLRAEKRYSHGLTFVGAFNYQKAMSIGYEANAGAGYGGSLAYQDPRDRLADYARSNLDQRFRFVFSHVWELPWLRTAKGIKGAILGGWAVNGIIQLTSGLPVTVTQTGDSHNTGAGSAPRPHVVAGQKVTRVLEGRTLDRWFNTDAFIRSKCDGCPGEGVFMGPKGYGNGGKALFDSPALKTWDFALFKEFGPRERHRVQFRWEIFNFLNTPQFSAPSSAVGTATLGRITSTAANNREMQFGVKYIF